jgi:hypothetical protein
MRDDLYEAIAAYLDAHPRALRHELADEFEVDTTVAMRCRQRWRRERGYVKAGGGWRRARELRDRALQASTREDLQTVAVDTVETVSRLGAHVADSLERIAPGAEPDVPEAVLRAQQTAARTLEILTRAADGLDALEGDAGAEREDLLAEEDYEDAIAQVGGNDPE